MQRNAPALAVLAIAAAALCALALPLVAPVGPFYWDSTIYYDAAARIFDGQVPVVDFDAPVGPLGYWLVAAILSALPDAQILYAGSWSILIVTAPLMALICRQAAARSPAEAWLLASAFLLFSLLPFNGERFYPFPGADGFGIYNRHASQLLYVLVAALLFMRPGWAFRIVVAAAALALFLTKITGFVAALPLLAIAFLCGRMPLRDGVIAALAGLCGLLLLQLWLGLTSAYLRDIAGLVRMNESSLVAHLASGVATHFGTVASAAALALLLLIRDRRRLLEAARKTLGARDGDAFRSVAEHPAAWIGAALLGGIVFESQNWGGQAFIQLWPLMILIVAREWRVGARVPATLAALALAGASVLPASVEIGQRAVRSFAALANYETLETRHLGPLGAVAQRPEAMHRARMLLRLYRAHPDFYADLVAEGELPSYTTYAEPEFQLAWLMALDDAADSILAYEARTGEHFETILALNFTNPLPFLLGRSAPKHVAVGADPFRTILPPDEEVLRSLRATDLILWPRCPETISNSSIRQIWQAGLTGRRRIELSPCWDGLVRAGEG